MTVSNLCFQSLTLVDIKLVKTLINPLILSQVPLCMFCWTVNLNLAWTYYFTGILIASSVFIQH